MNWFVKGTVPEKDRSKHVERALQEGDCCDHVREDHNQAVMWTEERDSFGGDGKYVMCRECWDKFQEEEDNQPVTCNDCHRELPQKETSEYKWHGFYYPQGDEPLIICNTCSKMEVHQQRLARDKAAAERECEQERDDDWDGYDGPDDDAREED